MDYSWGELGFEVPGARLEKNCLRALPMAKAGSYDMSIEPQELELSDTVTVVWEIG